MKILITLLSFVASVSAMASPVTSAYYKCENDELKSANKFIRVELKVDNGQATESVNGLNIPTDTDSASAGFGIFLPTDFMGFQGNSMTSIKFQHRIMFDGTEYSEEARFGVQEIGSQTIGYLDYWSEIAEGTLETLLTCTKVIESK